MAVAYKNNKWYIVHSQKIIVNGVKTYPKKWIPTNVTDEKDKKLARKEEKKYLENLEKGLEYDPNLTVYGLSQIWMEQHVKSAVKPKAKATQIFYQNRLDIYIIPTIGAKLIRKLSVDDLDEVLRQCAENDKIDTTLRSVYATMSAMFAWGKSKRKIETNLMEYVDRPVVAEREYTLLVPEDIPKFLQAIMTPKRFETKYARDQKFMYHTMFLVELTTALRIDELCGIRETDIDFEKKVLSIRQQVVSPGTSPEFGPAKDRREKRPDRLPLTDTVIEALQDEIEHKAKKKAIAKEKGWGWREYGLVFTNKTGGPVDSKNLNTRILKSILKTAGLPPMKFHELRHSVLTILANLNEDPNAICDLARHADMNFLKKTYLHKNVESQRTISKKLEEIVIAPEKKTEESTAKEA
jgi:integrase